MNSNCPRCFGDGMIHMSHFDAMVLADHPLPEISKVVHSKEHEKIGQYIADNLIEDGATLQTGLLFV